MLSRVAERMYWAGRYLERIETTARLISVYDGLLMDLPANDTLGWSQLLRVVAAETDYLRRHNNATQRQVLGYLLADKDNPTSLLNAIHSLRENIRTARDHIPSEGWECANELNLLARRDLPGANNSDSRFECLSECVTRCQLLSGLLAGTMSHGPGYQFFKCGNYLERADMTTRVVDVAAAALASDNPPDQVLTNSLWMGVLKSVCAAQMYRQYVRRRVTARDAVTFLMANEQFPKAVQYATQALQQALRTLPNNSTTIAAVEPVLHMIGTVTELDMGSPELHEAIDRLQLQFADIHRSIEDTWFLKQ